MRPGATLVLLAVLATALPAAATPLALGTVILASVPTASSGGGAGTAGGYVLDRAVVDVDGTLTFTNADIRAHDVVSRANGPPTNPWCARHTDRACPLFASPLIGGDPLAGPASAAVEGTAQLTPLASYPFYCTIHPGMEGTLTTI